MLNPQIIHGPLLKASKIILKLKFENNIIIINLKTLNYNKLQAKVVEKEKK